MTRAARPLPPCPVIDVVGTAAAVLLPLLLLLLPYPAAARKDPRTTLLNEWPMLMAHDAATTYISQGSVDPLDSWTKTQPDGGLAGLFGCGARAFDWRPILLKNGTLAMHHSWVEVDFPLEGAIDDLLAAMRSQNNTAENLVILGVTDCFCQDQKANPCTCLDEVVAFLSSKKIPLLTDTELRGGLMTAANATALGSARGDGGAAILAVTDWVENYDSQVVCSGYDRGLYTCYADSSSKAFPLDRMWEYIDNITKAGPSPSHQLATVQCLWEESPASIAIGTLHGSSLLKDESKSQLNALLTQRIHNGVWNVSSVGIIEVNNICDGGAALLEAFRESA